MPAIRPDPWLTDHREGERTVEVCAHAIVLALRSPTPSSSPCVLPRRRILSVRATKPRRHHPYWEGEGPLTESSTKGRGPVLIFVSPTWQTLCFSPRCDIVEEAPKISRFALTPFLFRMFWNSLIMKHEKLKLMILLFCLTHDMERNKQRKLKWILCVQTSELLILFHSHYFHYIEKGFTQSLR